MNPRKLLNKKRVRRAARNRAKIFGTAAKPRLAIKRSNRFIYAQLIDDEKSRTLVQASSREIKVSKGSKSEKASAVGELIAKRALELSVKRVVLDRRTYKYHGRVKALAEGAKRGGLKI